MVSTDFYLISTVEVIMFRNTVPLDRTRFYLTTKVLKVHKNIVSFDIEMVHSNAAACYDLLRSMLTTTLSHSNVWYIKVIYRDYILKDFGFIFNHGYFFGSKSSNPITKADQANPIQPIHFLQLTKFNS